MSIALVERRGRDITHIYARVRTYLTRAYHSSISCGGNTKAEAANLYGRYSASSQVWAKYATLSRTIRVHRSRRNVAGNSLASMKHSRESLEDSCRRFHFFFQRFYFIEEICTFCSHNIHILHLFNDTIHLINSCR